MGFAAVVLMWIALLGALGLAVIGCFALVDAIKAHRPPERSDLVQAAEKVAQSHP